MMCSVCVDSKMTSNLDAPSPFCLSTVMNHSMKLCNGSFRATVHLQFSELPGSLLLPKDGRGTCKEQ